MELLHAFGTVLHDIITLISVVVLFIWSVAASQNYSDEQGPEQLGERLILLGGWACTLWLALT